MKIQRILENSGMSYKVVEDEFSNICLLVPIPAKDQYFFCYQLNLMQKQDYLAKVDQTIERIIQRMQVNPNMCREVTFSEW